MDERHRQALIAGAATSLVVAAMGLLFFGPNRDTDRPSAAPTGPEITCEDWHVVPVHVLGPGASALHDVDGTPGDVWAVGTQGTGPLVLHGVDGAWELVVPDLRGVRGQVELSGVSVLAPDDVWIVGAARTEQAGQSPVLLHWDGRTLQPDPGPRRPPDDTALLAVGATDDLVVAVGGTGDIAKGTGTPVIFTSQGRAWSVERTDSETGVLRDVVVDARGSIVAVGFRGDPVERVSIPFAEARSGPRFREFLAEERARNALYAAGEATGGDVWTLGTMAALFDGRRFRRVPVALAGTTVLGVSQPSAKRADAVGVKQTQAGPRPVFARWNGRRWQPLKVPATSEFPGSLEAIVTARSGSGWVVGTRETAEGGEALVLRKGC
ncbi:MAG: hypothetical protein WEA54_05005 [Actinomycetota bacterium]